MTLADKLRVAAIAAAVGAVAAITLASARGEPIAPDRVRVVDGDTIAVGKVTYRLVGFDAPETGMRAKCASEGNSVIGCKFRTARKSIARECDDCVLNHQSHPEMRRAHAGWMSPDKCRLRRPRFVAEGERRGLEKYYL